jgi:hypothetical protein
MPLSMIFWLIFILWVISGFYWGYSRSPNGLYAGGILLVILIFILGWQVNGFIIK